MAVIKMDFPAIGVCRGLPPTTHLKHEPGGLVSDGVVLPTFLTGYLHCVEKLWLPKALDVLVL